MIKVASNRPFYIRDSKKIYIVERGEVSIFLSSFKDSSPEGVRRYFYSAKVGELIVGANFNSTLPNHGFILSGLFGTAIREATRAEVERGLESLFNRIGEPFSISSREVTLVNGSADLSAGRLFKLNSLSVVSSSVKGYLLGVAIPKEFVVSNALIYLDEDGRVESRKVAKDSKVIVQSIDVYLMAFVKLEESKALEESIQFKKKLIEKESFITKSISKLLDIVNKRGKKELFEEEDPSFAVAKIIGKHQDIEIVKPKFDKNYRLDPLSEIARFSKFMIRNIRLEDGWWSKDAGAFYGFIDNSPIALIPKGRGYKLINPSTKESLQVTEEIAKRVSNVAYMLYRPFPNKKLTIMDIFKFSINSRIINDFITIGIVGVVGGILDLFTPIVTSIIFSSVIPAAEYGTLAYISLFLVTISITQTLFSLVRSVAIMRFQGRMDLELQPAIWSRLLALPIPFFEKYNSSDLSSRANSIIKIRQMLTGAAMSAILGAIFSIFKFGLLFSYSIPLTLLAIVLTIIPVVVTLVVGRFKLGIVREAMALNGDSSTLLMQIIKGISKFKMIGGESRAFSLWSEKYHEQSEMESRAFKIGFYSSNFQQIYPVITTVLLFFMVSRSNMPIGTFLGFQAAFSGFMSALLGLTGTFMTLQRVIPLYERAKPILDAIPEVTEKKEDPGKLVGSIKMSNIRYSYGDGPEVLKGVSIEAKPSEFIALVGGSGSGKSTLFRLLIGFDRPSEGTVSFDGRNIEDIDIQLARREMGVVLQKGQLTPGDIFTNIIGPYNLTVNDAWSAAIAAGLDEDIKSMPMGMHTVVANGTLSGGQQQRVRIARALVNRPKMILFDSATSALDNKTQSIVINSLASMNATKIIIAQRLSTIKDADKIYVFDNGEIVEEGKYDDLMKLDGVFAEFARRQIA